jgi:hypothetical protein
MPLSVKSSVPSNEGTLFNAVVSTKLVLSDDEFYLCNRAGVEKCFCRSNSPAAFQISMRKPDAIAWEQGDGDFKAAERLKF